MTGVQIVLLCILGVCIGLSGLFSGSETAIVALPRERIPGLTTHGTRGQRLIDLANDTERTLGTLLLANNFVNILAASIGTILVIDLITAFSSPGTGEALGPWASTVVLTGVILIVGEITPKTMAARRPEQFALFVAPTIWWLGRILHPIARVFVGAARVLLRMLGVKGKLVTAATEDDIMALALLSEAAGHIDPHEREILESLFKLADRPVRDVMTPRVNVISLSSGIDDQEARRAVALYGHSSFPVVAAGGTLDDLVGVLFVKDLLRRDAPGPIDALVREPVYVPETTSVLASLQELRSRRVAFAVVLDEHGGVEGIVTVKDLMAELVGEIQDEYDPREPTMFQLEPRMWVVEGRVPVEDVQREIGVELPNGPYTSVGGLFLAAAGRIPEEGDQIAVASVTMTVLQMDKKRIHRLRIEHEESTGDAPLPVQ
ncbi:MAG: hemolysin family protein [Acidimicrobiia bacterium]